MRFVVYRGSWHRGRPNSGLLTNENKMCCLGQVACELGVPLEYLRGMALPANLVGRHPKFSSMLMKAGLVQEAGSKEWMQTVFALGAASVNDDGNYPEAARENFLREKFSMAGHELEFVDGVAPWFEAA